MDEQGEIAIAAAHEDYMKGRIDVAELERRVGLALSDPCAAFNELAAGLPPADQSAGLAWARVP